MSTKARKQSSLALTQARKELAGARMSGDPRQIGIAAANLGLALFKVNKSGEGARRFYEAERIFNELDDFQLQLHCLSLKTIAYQFSEQLPQAFETARKVEALALEKGELTAQIDALATQGQILIDSGEEVFALDKLSTALQMAEETADTRRIMNVTGALGNYCLTIAAPEKAESYFDQARQLAQELGDRQSEIGFYGNLGALLEWKREYRQAGKIFAEVLAYMRETDNQEAEIQALRHLVQICVKSKDDQQLAQYALEGVTAAKKAADDHVYYFYDQLVAAYGRLEQVDLAQKALADAVETARTTNNSQAAVDLLLKLGESLMLTDKLEHALAVYQQAVEATERVQRLTDKAQIIGRMGLILAELNQIDAAINNHKQAIEMAQRHELPELEGEQAAMLGIAYFEKGELDQARLFVAMAVQTYTELGLQEQVDRAQDLLAVINKEQ